MPQCSTKNDNDQELNQDLAESTIGDGLRSVGVPASEIQNVLRSRLNTGGKLPQTALEDDTCDTKQNVVSHEKGSNNNGCGTCDNSDRSFKGITTLSLPTPPLDSFHPAIKDAILNIAKCKQCPVEVPVSAFIAVSAALVGRARQIKIKEGWREPGNLFLAIVARSAAGKSPGQSVVLKPVYHIEKKSQDDYQKTVEQYELDLRSWEKAKEPRPPKPQKPQRKDIVLDDWTTESVFESLLSNPKGVLLMRDELSGLFMDLDKYSGEKGSTKTKLMTAYDTKSPWKTSRINTNRNGYVSNPCVSIYGGIQPAVACDIFSKQDQFSGFLGRFDFIQAVQKAPATFSAEEEVTQTIQTIEKLCTGLDKLSLLSDGESITIEVSKNAKILYKQWHDNLAEEAFYSSDEAESGLLSKVKARGLRICLLLHCMEACLTDQNEKFPISSDIMKKALILMDWLRAHTQATWRMLKQEAQTPTSQEVRVAQAIICLQNRIQNGWLSTGDIAQKVNDTQNKRFHLSAAMTGKICTSLGLVKKSTSSARGFLMTPEDIIRLLNLLPIKQASQMSSVSQPPNSSALKGDTTKK